MKKTRRTRNWVYTNNSYETNLLRHNIQENDKNSGNLEFHDTSKKQIIIV
jgi:hypothetical protein